METLNLSRYFADFLNRCGAINTEIIETKSSKLFDYFIVCSAEDKLHAQELLIYLLDFAKNEFNQINCGLEGYKKANWVIADFGKIVVHIFSDKTREKFNVEKLWK